MLTLKTRSIVNRFVQLLCLSVLLLQSCHKRIVHQKSIKGDTVFIQAFRFHTYQGRGKVSYAHENRIMENININVRIKKDSTIWMNLAVSGITAARLLITRDSITLVSFIDKSYKVFDYASLTQHFGFKIDYFIIQALLLGNPIGPQNMKHQVIQKQTDYIALHQTIGPLNLIYHALTSIQKIDKVELHTPPSNNSLKIKYSDFKWVEDQIAPQKINVEIQYNVREKTSAHKITISYNTTKINNELKFPFRIPKRYERK